MNKNFITYPFVLLIMVLLSACTSIKSSPVYTENDKAIRGYDPVAFFVVDKAVVGKESINHQYNGTTWLFDSEKNKTLFVNNSEKYAPQYGGYCSYAMANGFIVSSDPEAYSIVDGKLYLNYSKSVRDSWKKDIPYYILNADKEWLKRSQE